MQSVNLNLYEYIHMNTSNVLFLNIDTQQNNHQWKITLEAGSILGMTPRNLEKKVSLLRRTMNLTDEDIREILSKQPAVLHYSADRNLAPTILFLVRGLDLSKADLRTMIMDSPSILGYSQDNLRKKIRFFATLYSSDSDRIRNLLVGTPKLLLSSADTLVSRMRFLHNEIQFSQEELQGLYERNPRLLLYSLDGNLREKIVFFFILSLQLSTADVKKILLSYPQVMDYNLENHMKPIASYCMTELEFSANEFGKIIRKWPRLLTYSLFRIKHVIGYLRYELELDSRQSKRVLFQAPQVVGLGESNVKEKLDLLRYRLDLTTEEMVRMNIIYLVVNVGISLILVYSLNAVITYHIITQSSVFSKMPTLVCLGINTSLVPKLEYLAGMLNDESRPPKNHLLKEAILLQPTLLGYSLTSRIQPRMQRMIAEGISPEKITVGISMSESKFEQWLQSTKARTASRLVISKYNSTLAGALYDVLNFDEEELNSIMDSVVEINDWTVPLFKSWIADLELYLNVSCEEMKNTLLSYPQLLERSFQRKLKHRMQQINLEGVSAREIVTLITMDDDDAYLANITLISLRSQYLEMIEALQDTLMFDQDEVDMLLLSLETNLAVRGGNIQSALNYLLDLAYGDVQKTKSVVLMMPELIIHSSGELMEKVDKLKSSLSISTTTDLLPFLGMTEEEQEKELSMITIQRILHFTNNEIDDLKTRGKDVLNTGMDARIAILLGGEVHESKPSRDEVKTALLSRPKLLSCSIDKLPSVTSVLATIKSGSMTHRFYNESLSVLRDSLGLSVEEASHVVSRCRYLSLRDPDDFIVLKLNYLLSVMKREELKLCVLNSPRLLDYSLDDHTIPRMNILLSAGVEPSQIIHIISLTKNEIEARSKLHTRLNLTDAEHLLPAWKNWRRMRRRCDLNAQYLMSHLNESIVDLKTVLLREPKLLTFSLSKTIRPRMEMLMDSCCPPTDISKIAKLSQRKAEQHCLKCYIYKRFGLSPKQMNTVFPVIKRKWESPKAIREKGEYLFEYVFEGSMEQLKTAVLSNPLLLKQSLSNTIKPRTVVFKYLVSVGLQYSPSETARFYTQSNSKFSNELVPQIKTWSPLIFKKNEGSSYDAMTEKEDIVSMLKDFKSSLSLTYSDESNREAARIVHWR